MPFVTWPCQKVSQSVSQLWTRTRDICGGQQQLTLSSVSPILGDTYMKSSLGGEGGPSKADVVRKLSNGGCVNLRTRGGGGSKMPKLCGRHKYNRPFAVSSFLPLRRFFPLTDSSMPFLPRERKKKSIVPSLLSFSLPPQSGKTGATICGIGGGNYTVFRLHATQWPKPLSPIGSQTTYTQRCNARVVCMFLSDLGLINEGPEFTFKSCVHDRYLQCHLCTGLGKRVVPRLRELAPSGQRESGGGIHTT